MEQELRYICDTHCHFSLIKSETIDKNIKYFAAHTHSFLLDVAIQPRWSPELQRLHEQYSFLHYSSGIHPSMAEKPGIETFMDDVDKEAEKACAIGETGLDKLKYEQTFNKQCMLFEAHILLAQKHNLPIIIHNRNADKEVLQIHGGSCRGVMHCFSSNKKTAFRAIDAGLYLSFAGNLTYPRNGELRNLLRLLPRQYILSETDAPYLAPQKYRGMENQAVYVKETMFQIAECLEMQAKECAAMLYENACRLFLSQ